MSCTTHVTPHPEQPRQPDRNIFEQVVAEDVEQAEVGAQDARRHHRTHHVERQYGRAQRLGLDRIGVLERHEMPVARALQPRLAGIEHGHRGAFRDQPLAWLWT
ncbi:MAG: hypothetical protein WDN24_13220 [Sphingomonas sp.]